MSYETYFKVNQIRSELDGALRVSACESIYQVFKIHWDDCVGDSVRRKVQDALDRYRSDIDSVINRLQNEASKLSGGIESDLTFINSVMGK